MEKTDKLVLVGDGEFAEIAYEYFTHDSPYEVVAFGVEREHLKREELFGLPVVPFEEVEDRYPPAEHKAFVAITSTQLNRVRARLYRATRAKGFATVSYVSSHAFVWRNVEIGENCFIFEHNVLQYHVKVGHNVILWSGNHVGHRTVIEDHCFLASHVVISGYCRIGASSFLGVNSALRDGVTIARDTVLGVGAVVTKNTEAGQVYVGNPAKPVPRMTSYSSFKVPEDQV